MTSQLHNARQPVREAWSRDKLFRTRAHMMNYALDRSSKRAYSSALNSYLTFCQLHDLLIDPVPDTLSFYVAFMCNHIEPHSVRNYLSGISNSLETMFPYVRESRQHILVTKTLQGGLRLFSHPTRRCEPLAIEHLTRALATLPCPAPYDDLLFLSLLFVGFCGLLRLGELTVPDAIELRNASKLSRRNSVQMLPDVQGFSFWLQRHKVDKSFEGSRIVITYNDQANALPLFCQYLSKRDVLFPYNNFLWLTSTGDPPTRHWFMSRFRKLFPDTDWAGQSLRAGGATFLAELNTPYDLIQAIGRWSSDSFRIYLWKNPTLLAVMVRNRLLNMVPCA